jgi:hypothetical protein
LIEKISSPILRLLLALDQGACLILTGQNDFTISAWAYIRHTRYDKPFFMNAINKVFFWQSNHCESALIWEVQQAKKLYLHYKAEYEDLIK